jgi:outer membrane receptor protein involved in Fe transport
VLSSTGCGVPVPVNNNPSYVDVLPSVSLRHALDSNSGLRAVYGRGVSRPDANPAGIIRAGFFFKQIDNTLIGASYTATGRQYAGDLVSQWLNVSNAELHGFEISYQQRLAMLPGFLKGFGVLANYSWTGSRVKSIPGRLDSSTLQRQAQNSWNISPTYDYGLLAARVGMSYNGASIYQYEYQTSSDVSHLGPTGPTGDVYTCPLPIGCARQLSPGPWALGCGLRPEPHRPSFQLLSGQPDLRQPTRVVQGDLRRRATVQPQP